MGIIDWFSDVVWTHMGIVGGVEMIFKPHCIVESSRGRVGTVYILGNSLTMDKPSTLLRIDSRSSSEVLELRQSVRRLKNELDDALTMNKYLRQEVKMLNAKLRQKVQ